MPWAAAISAGASLLGGIFGRSSERKAIAAQNEYNKPVNIRARAEEAGFNPLLFIGPGVGQQTATGGTNYMGSAIADAGLQIADQMSKNKELGRLEKLSEENKKLAEKVTSLTIRPKVAGVYAQRAATPALADTVKTTPEFHDMIGPKKPVKVVDAVSGKWFGIHPAVANRLDIKDGDPFLQEDREAMLGDVLSEGALVGVMGDAAAAGHTGIWASPVTVKTPLKPKPTHGQKMQRQFGYEWWKH